jgi:ribosomal protein L34E
LAAILRRVVARRDEALMNRRSLAESVCYNETTSTPPIQFKSPLNKVHRLKSFVYHSVRMSGEGDKTRIIAEVVPRANSRPRCSGCGKPRPGYDRMPRPREFEFIPVWNIPVSLSYTMRRVDCPACGIKVESVPWAQGKHACCDVYRHFLASWARRLS